jgi:uncharacterized protein YgbK (DUF1537 family)
LAQILIVADDLSGAADCGIACAVQGLDTLVVLDEASVDAEVLAVDANTRAMAPNEAAVETARLVHKYAREGQQVLFKKFDSTLRGHIGVELAAALEAWRSAVNRSSAIVVVAPAFPTTGRTTIGGRQWLDGVQLEPDLPDILETAGLQTSRVGLEVVRSGRLPGFLQTNGEAATAFVCDAETEADLRSIGEAAASLRERAVWAGSAGLARCLPPALNVPAKRPRAAVPPDRKGPVLVVVGSLAPLSRRQAAVLAATNELAVVTVRPQGLLAGPGAQEWREDQDLVVRALADGRDVLTVLGAEERVQSDMASHLCSALARMLAPCRAAIAALVLTGGETARGVLTAFGMRSLVPIREVEPGVPLALASTENGERLPVITKAGAFGAPDSLVRCRAALRNLLR